MLEFIEDLFPSFCLSVFLVYFVFNECSSCEFLKCKLRQFFQVSETSMQSRNEAGILLSLIYNSKSTCVTTLQRKKIFV